MARPTETAERRTEDGFIFVVLVLAIAFFVFMASVPIWLSSFLRGLTG